LIYVVHALGVIDDHSIEAEQLEQAKLPWTDVLGHELGHVFVMQLRRVLNGHEARLRG
jgi:hypothetical protein